MNEKELKEKLEQGVDRKELEKELKESFMENFAQIGKHLRDLDVTLSDRLADLFAGLRSRKKLRGKWPLVLQLLKEKFPPSQHPNGFPDPAFAPRQSLVMWLREFDPSRLGSLDEATLDKAIAEYDREIRNSSE
jgi:hypothetical protein